MLAGWRPFPAHISQRKDVATRGRGEEGEKGRVGKGKGSAKRERGKLWNGRKRACKDGTSEGKRRGNKVEVKG